MTGTEFAMMAALVVALPIALIATRIVMGLRPALTTTPHVGTFTAASNRWE